MISSSKLCQHIRFRGTSYQVAQRMALIRMRFSLQLGWLREKGWPSYPFILYHSSTDGTNALEHCEVYRALPHIDLASTPFLQRFLWEGFKTLYPKPT